MRAAWLLEQLGLVGGAPVGPLARRLVLLALVLYGASFALFYPRLHVNYDASVYARQAALLLEGRSKATRVDPFSEEVRESWVGDYPLGTAALMAPFVAVAGWRGSFALPALSLAAAVLLTAAWIRDERRSPVFALVLLGFPPALVMGRVAMSDVPSAAVAALGLWLFWRGRRSGPLWWLAAGLVAGGSAALRPPNVLVFAPLFAGALLRRDRHVPWLVLGGLLGTGLRLLSSLFLFGDPLAAKTPYLFDPGGIMERLPLFLFGLLVLVPGGLLLGSAYRGERRPEIVATPLLFFLFFLLQSYSSIEVGPARRVVLALRYFLPVLPVVAFAMAESTPRLLGAALARVSPRRRPLALRATAALAATWLAGVGIACAAVHPALAAWSRGLAEMQEEIRSQAPPDAVLVTNWSGTGKFLHGMERKYETIRRDDVDAAGIARLVERHGRVLLMLVDRRDSEWWRAQREKNEAFVTSLRVPRRLVYDRQVTPNEHLRVWALGGRPLVPGGDGR